MLAITTKNTRRYTKITEMPITETELMRHNNLLTD